MSTLRRIRSIQLHWWIIAGMIIGAALGAVVHSAYGPEVATQTALYRTFDGLTHQGIPQHGQPLAGFSRVASEGGAS